MSSAVVGSPAPTALGRKALIKEVALVTLCAIAYSMVCAVAPVTARTAFAHARQILRIEQLLSIDIELAANKWLQSHDTVADIAATYYSVSFFALTFGALAVIWIKRPARYHFARNTLFVMTGGAMITYWIYPLAPPRLLEGTEFVDSVATQSGLGAGYARMYAELGNPYAAMPSMHTGWAVWVAACLGMFVWTKWWQRALLALHPAITVVIIIVTGNHYVLDAVAGALYFLCALSVISAPISRAPHVAAQGPGQVRVVSGHESD